MRLICFSKTICEPKWRALFSLIKWPHTKPGMEQTKRFTWWRHWVKVFVPCEEEQIMSAQRQNRKRNFHWLRYKWKTYKLQNESLYKAIAFRVVTFDEVAKTTSSNIAPSEDIAEQLVSDAVLSSDLIHHGPLRLDANVEKLQSLYTESIHSNGGFEDDDITEDQEETPPTS